MERRDLYSRDQYPCCFGGKQDGINSAIVQYAIENGYIGNKQIVYDPSCGPLGTEVAKSHIEQLESLWIGSDIAISPLKHRQNVFCADATRIPLATESIHTCISVFAMSNIPDITTAIQEFSRITKKDGYLIIADPGISKKASDIAFYCYLVIQDHNPLDYLSESTALEINNFLNNQQISEGAYLDTTLKQHGLNLEEYEYILNQAYNKNKKQRRAIQKLMAAQQREFIKSLTIQNGLTLLDEGYILSQTNDSIWNTSDVTTTSINPTMSQSIETTVLVFKK